MSFREKTEENGGNPKQEATRLSRDLIFPESGFDKSGSEKWLPPPRGLTEIHENSCGHFCLKTVLWAWKEHEPWLNLESVFVTRVTLSKLFTSYTSQVFGFSMVFPHSLQGFCGP